MVRKHNLKKEEGPDLNLWEILVGNLTRLRFIVRFSNCPRIHDENVAEHSFYTALYAHLIATSLLYKGVNINVAACVGKALMHDVDECFSGDFIRMFKHSDMRLKDEINKASQRFTNKLVTDITPVNELRTHFWSDWDAAKSGPEGRIVSFCDYLSVLSYIAQEIDAGNARMKQQLPELRKFHESFNGPDYDIVRPYVFQCAQVIQYIESGKIRRSEDTYSLWLEAPNEQ